MEVERVFEQKIPSKGSLLKISLPKNSLIRKVFATRISKEWLKGFMAPDGIAEGVRSFDPAEHEVALELMEQDAEVVRQHERM